MGMENLFRTEFLAIMGEVLDAEQIKRLDTALLGLMRQYNISEKSTEVTVYDNSNERIIKQYVANMRLSGRSEKTIEQYILAINQMIDAINKPFAEITTNDIRWHLAMYQQERKVSKRTIDNKRKYLSAFFRWLAEEEFVNKNPMLRVKQIKDDNVIKKPFTDKEVEMIRDSVKTFRDKALIEFLLSSGCRVSEVVKLNINDIDIPNRECVVFGKGNKERKVYISEKAIYHLNKYILSRKDDNPALFLNKYGNRLSKFGIESLMRDMGKRIHVDKIHPHRFRRTFATNALNKGMPVQYVQKILGHQSLDTTMVYCSSDEEILRVEHKKVA